MQLRYRGQKYEMSSVTSNAEDGYSNRTSDSSASVTVPPVVILRYRGTPYLKF